MRKYFLKITAMFMATFVLSTQALIAAPNYADLEVAAEDVAFDVATIDAEFAELTKIEALVKENELTSVSALVALDETIDLSSLRSVASIEKTQGFDWSNFDWPSGLWGFLCCPIGFFVVITNKNKSSDEKISFWIGVAASTVLSAITTPFYYTN